MPFFRVLLKGQHVLLFDRDANQLVALGFYTTRWVRAASTALAEEAARKHALLELEKTGTRNQPGDPILVEIKETSRVSWLTGLRHRSGGAGFSFFPEGS